MTERQLIPSVPMYFRVWPRANRGSLGVLLKYIPALAKKSAAPHLEESRHSDLNKTLLTYAGTQAGPIDSWRLNP